MQCPYCNAVIDSVVLAAAGARVRCPHCGDSFPRGTGDETAFTATPPAPRAGDPPPVQRSNGLAALVIVGVMITMAGIGLSYMLWTTPARQRLHPDPVKLFAAERHRPTELPALGYLPFDSQVVAGIHVADLLQDRVGQQLLEKPRLEMIDWPLERVQLWTDLTPEAIDHIALGVHAPPDELPGMVLAVQTRRPYSIESLQRKHSRQPAEQFYDRPLFRFTTQPVGSGCLWCADERTLVFMLRFDRVERAHLDRIPLRPRTGNAGLPEDVQQLIRERLPVQPVAWVVGDIAELTSNAAWLKLTPLREDVAGYLQRLKSLALGLETHQDIALLAALEGNDAAATHELESGLRKSDTKSLRIIGPPPPQVTAATCVGLAARGPLDALSMTALVTQNRLLVQYRGNAAAIRDIFKQQP